MSKQCKRDAWSGYRLVFHMAALTSLVAPGLACGQIRTDGSTGPAQTLNGPRYQIQETLGRRAGANLFHSFQNFNLASGETAVFTTASPGINNVISRVTGGTASQINGQIALNAASGAPAFYFINPAGVTFGAGASIDVPGAFHVGTADYLKFADGKFFADPKAASSFSTSPPEAFGFLGNTRAALSLSEGALLATKPRQPFTLAAGDIRIDNATAQTSAGGNIRVAAVGQQAADIGLIGKLPELAGDLVLTRGAAIIANTGPIGDVGDIAVSAGNLRIDAMRGANLTGIGSSAGAGTTGNAGDIDVAVRDTLSLLNGAIIASGTFSSGNSGTVRVNAGTITIDGGGLLTRITAGTVAGSSGNGGDVEVKARNSVSVLNGGSIEAPAQSSGHAGTVKLCANDILIDGQGKTAGVTGTALPDSSGDAGMVSVAATNSLRIADGGNITSSTFGKGNAGAVQVQAGVATLDGRANPGLTGISSSAEAGSSGNAGSVTVSVADKLSMVSGASIASPTRGIGSGGAINIDAGSILIDHQRAQKNLTGISSSAERNSVGHAGKVVVTAREDLTVASGGEISSNATAQGDAGSLNIQVGNTLSVLSGGKINSSTVGSGKAGTIDASAKDIIVAVKGAGQNSLISASAAENSSGQTGNVSLKAANVIRISDDANVAIQNGANVADPGALTPTLLSLSANRVLIDGGQITAASTGNIAASNIALSYQDRLVVSSRGRITTSSRDGDAGTIRIEGGKVLALDNAQITTSVLGDRSGNGGDIDIKSQAMVMRTGFIQANTAASASGGNVAIDVQTLVPSLGSLLMGGSVALDFSPGIPGFNVIQAAAPTGLSGNVAISSPILNISATLASLRTQVIDSGGFGRSPCQTTRGSGLLRPGRGGLPPGAGRLLNPAFSEHGAPADIPVLPVSFIPGKSGCKKG